MARRCSFLAAAAAVLALAGTTRAQAAEVVRPGIHMACKSHDILARLQRLDGGRRSGSHDRLLHSNLLDGRCVQLPPGDEVRVLGEDWRRGLVRVYRVGDAGIWWTAMPAIWKDEEVAVRARAARRR